jgi:hypothetical protein
MNKIFIYFSGILLAICMGLFSCTTAKDKAPLKIIYYSDGTKKMEFEYKDDSIKHGLCRSFYPTSKIKSEAIYRNNKKDGLYKFYFENGKLGSIGRYKEGQQDSVWLFYLPSGKIRTMNTFLKGKPFGLTIDYFESGQLKHYKYFAFQGELHYIKSYDIKGHSVSDQGDPIPMIIVDDTLWNKEKKFHVDIHVATPPTYKIAIFTGVKPPTGDTVWTLHPFEKIRNNILRFDTSFMNHGYYDFFTKARIKDTETGIISETCLQKFVIDFIK